MIKIMMAALMHSNCEETSISDDLLISGGKLFHAN